MFDKKKITTIVQHEQKGFFVNQKLQFSNSYQVGGWVAVEEWSMLFLYSKTTFTHFHKPLLHFHKHVFACGAVDAGTYFTCFFLKAKIYRGEKITSKSPKHIHILIWWDAECLGFQLIDGMSDIFFILKVSNATKKV